MVAHVDIAPGSADEGITIRENANAVRLRNLMRDIGVAPGSRSRFRPARLAKTLWSLMLVCFWRFLND
jgi:hypothetical protein